MFRASQIPLTKEILNEINSILFKFVWKSGRDKIKRRTLISDYKNGGLRMPHIETLIKWQRIMYSQLSLRRTPSGPASAVRLIPHSHQRKHV